MSVPAGTTVASYTIERLLGRGGMGEVYLATQAGLGRPVALKLLTQELAADEASRDRFVAESRLAASLDHPHIVPIYEAGAVDGRLFLAMRYVDGSDLGAILASGPLEPRRALDLLAGIAAALDAAHDRGLVHRDVKPGNILVARVSGGTEHAYLGDFGLVKLLGSDAGFTRSGQLVGSVDYVAPEQIEGGPVDGRADVYSLACVLYACLAGRPPYPRETEVATLWAHVQATPPRPSDVDPGLAAFDEVVASGMTKEPGDRFATAGELLVAARAATTSGTTAGSTRGAAAPTPAALASPATAPAGSTPGAPNNLPLQLSSFVGRDAELAELEALLEERRLVTLTGPGGSGKTRLALSVASRAAGSFPEGVCFVELASITDPALVPAQIAFALGVREASGESIEDALVGFLEPRRLLLVLDNLEQVVGVGPLVSRLLARSPGLTILGTSRLLLRVRSETEFAVRPLGLPDIGYATSLDNVGRSEALRLFAARAAEARADFRITDENAGAVAAICVRVDGLPLAIELAAARVRLLSPRQILERLSDRLALLSGGAADLPERQQGLRSTITWSHDLLDEPARIAFRRLSVFDGGLTFEAAEAVCGDEATGSLLEAMTALVDGNLVGRVATGDDEPRFAMLETIREFAAEQLAAAGEATAIGDRHFAYFVQLGRRFEREQTRESLEAWLRRLDRDRANLAAALAWGLRTGQVAATAELFESLIEYTRARWHSRQVRDIVVALLAAPTLDDTARSHVLHEAASRAVRQGDYAGAEAFASESLAIARRRGDAHVAVGAGHVLAISAGERGDQATEAEHVAAMIEDADRLGEPRMEIVARSHVALRALRLRDFDEAAARYGEIVTRMRAIDVMRESLGSGLFNRGLAELHAGSLAAAAASFSESADIARSMDDREMLGYLLEGYAALAIMIERPESAARFQGAAASSLEAVGSALEAFEAEMSARTEASTRAALGDDAYEAARTSGGSEPLERVLEAALNLAGTIE